MKNQFIWFLPRLQEIILKLAALKNDLFKVTEDEVELFSPLCDFISLHGVFTFDVVLISDRMKREREQRVQSSNVRVLRGFGHHRKGNSKLPRLEPEYEQIVFFNATVKKTV
jgi:hypothetical protein